MSETLNIKFDDHDLEFIRAAAKKDEMRPEQVVKRWMRLGQTVDHHLRQDKKLRFLNPATGELTDPFDTGPKMAPMPAPCSACERSQRREWTEPEEHTCGLAEAAAWENEGGA
jgi:hypothetical protein